MRRAVHTFSGLFWALAILAFLTVGLRQEGFLWRWWSTPRVVDAAKRDKMDVSRLYLGINNGKTQRDLGRLDLAVIGNSATGFAINLPEMREAWRTLGRGDNVELFWIPGADNVGVHILTQHVLARGVDTLALCLSPTMTLADPDQPYDVMFVYQWYLTRDVVPPTLEPYGYPTPNRPDTLKNLLADYWPPLRYRHMIFPFTKASLIALEPGYAEKMAQHPAPFPWFRNLRREKFDEQRATFLKTNKIADYMAAYDAGFPRGRRGVQYFADQLRTQDALAPNMQWAALEAWVHLVREHGITPVIMILPHNPIFTRPDSGQIYGLPEGQPLMDPALFAAWRADVRAFCERLDIETWDDFGIYSPMHFLDFQHQLPESSREYTDAFATKLAAALSPTSTALARR